jgi:hypothetical protein
VNGISSIGCARLTDPNRLTPLTFRLAQQRLAWFLIQLLILAVFVFGVQANFRYLSQGPLDLILESSAAGDFVLLIDERSNLGELGLLNGDRLLAVGAESLDPQAGLKGAQKLLRQAPPELELTVQTGEQPPRRVRITRQERVPQDSPLTPLQLALLSNSMDILLVGSYFVVAWLIRWRSSNDAFLLLISMAILLLGVRMTPQSEELGILRPALTPLILSIFYLGTILLGASLAMFPSGRLVPRWAGIFILFVMVYAFGHFFYPGFRNAPIAYQPLVILGEILLFGFGLGLQFYRYLRVSNPIERQQTKWVVYGIAIGFTGLYTYRVANSFFPFLTTYAPEVLPLRLALRAYFTLSLVAVPVTLAFSILRYRLFDIDLIIRRTLLYSSLTATLAAVYFGGILLMELLLGGALPERSSIAVVASTLLIAVLFNPLRRRIQSDIDRRFYRRKYDAEQALAEFTQAARSQTELAALTEGLVQVAEKTVQPEFASLWLLEAREGEG